MHVLFVEPSFPFNQREFVRGLCEAGARVTGIGERPAEYLSDDMKKWLHGYEQVPSVVHEQSLHDAVRKVQKREWVDRLEATVEAHIMAAAKVREACGIPGTSVKTSFLCRDKPAMKEVLRQAGIPTAQSAGVSSPAEARAFAKEVGYPIIIKPRDGAGAAGTSRISNDGELERAIVEAGIDKGYSAAAEEFIEGHEGFWDTISINGEPAHEFITHYYPNVLEAMLTRWISPVFVATNRLEADGYGEVYSLGRKVLKALDIGTSATHMEWFYGPKGLKFSEIGCRPPGVGAWDLYCAAHEIDIYKEWGMAIVHGRTSQRSSQRFAAGLVNLRPERDGRITGYSGLDEVERRFGEWIIDRHFPAPGAPTQPVEAGYMANAWMRMRYPDYDGLREMLNTVANTIKIHAG
jgi:hypothetical protein